MKVDEVRVYRDSAGDWRWKFVRSNGRVMADSSEGYRQAWRCEQAAEYVFGPGDVEIVRDEP